MDGCNQAFLPTECLLEINHYIFNHYRTESIISCTVRQGIFKAIIKFHGFSYLRILSLVLIFLWHILSWLFIFIAYIAKTMRICNPLKFLAMQHVLYCCLHAQNYKLLNMKTFRVLGTSCNSLQVLTHILEKALYRIWVISKHCSHISFLS